MLIFANMPKPITQIVLLALLFAVLVSAVITLFLWGARPPGGRLLEPQRWAGTVSGLAVCAAFFQYATTRWIAQVMEEYDNTEKYPYGPPSHITRSIIDNPDAPVQMTVRSYLFYDPSLTAWLGLVAGVFAILSYWID
jgi:hypothetical protein